MSVRSPVRPARRFASFVVDWLLWLYLPYCGFLVHYLRYVRLPWEIEKKIVLPTLPLWGWLAVLGGGAGMAFLTRLALHTIGLRAFGFVRKRGVGVVAMEDKLGLLPRRPWYRTAYGWAVALFLVATVVVGWHVVEVSLTALVRDIDKPARIVEGLLRPDFTHFLRVDPGTEDSIAGALVESLFMALLATVAGAAVAFPLSFLGARNITGKGWGVAVYGVTRGFFNVFRSVESIMWASIFAIWVGWGAFAGTMALFLHTIAALGKLYSEQVEHADPGPMEAIVAAGGNRLQMIRYAVIPQVIPPFLAFTVYRWDINLRIATVVSMVGGGGIGRLLFYYKDGLEWAPVGAIILTFAATVWVLDYLSGWVREKIT